MDDALGFPLHIPTLAFARGLAELMLGCLIGFVGLRDRQLNQARWWMLGLLVNGGALLLFPIQSADWERLLTIVNHLSLGISNALLLIGFWRFAGESGNRRQTLILIALVGIPVLSLVLWEFALPNARNRILTTILSQLVFFAALQSTLARPPREELAALCRGLRVMVVLYSLLFAWTYGNLAGVLPQTGHATNDYHRAIYSVASLLFMVALAAGCLALQFVRLAAHNADLAMMDWLTGLLNRRGLLHMAQRQDAQRQRMPASGALVCIDIDHFKRINDQYGHAGGDEVLRQFADLLRNHARAGDITARLGGEEFVLVLPGADETAATQVAERIRLSCAESPLSLPGKPPICYTVSLGVCTIANGETIMNTVDRADEALYAAKREGRNRVMRRSELQLSTSS